ncbi:mannose-1-phosphate guanylyltransferase [Brevundimonas sp. Leaf168]|uniref:mannose-1-phosphate guanylyltransferase n=1 Tax=Brevundimonas sp. Leaf168 TaxID=1736283 RepID=UPI001F3F9620|nr:mannose-1-phosphate guanylyltransferase [Brevundimonas sp. Leaf168]
MPVIFPVIMCGGSGTRLWPASRPSRPKQFIPLSGNRSLFQETVERVIDLSGSEGRLIVIGGAAHRQAICEQLKELGRDAIVLLEPEARESAAAMAAAAIWTKRQHPDAVNLFVASDHHIPDGDAFRAAVLMASEAAHAGRIVTFGVVPSGPSSAYGYIAPRSEGLAEVQAFVEKPDLVTAERYIAEGYLWNSGNFVVRADVLQDELRQAAAGLIEAVSDALDSSLSDGGALLLGRRFGDAPKISIDYAVMEKPGVPPSCRSGSIGRTSAPGTPFTGRERATSACMCSRTPRTAWSGPATASWSPPSACPISPSWSNGTRYWLPIWRGARTYERS